MHLREDAGIKPGSVRVCVDRDEHLSGERIGDSLLKVITVAGPLGFERRLVLHQACLAQCVHLCLVLGLVLSGPQLHYHRRAARSEPGV